MVIKEQQNKLANSGAGFQVLSKRTTILFV